MGIIIFFLHSFFKPFFGTLFTIRARDPKVEADRNITVFLQQKNKHTVRVENKNGLLAAFYAHASSRFS